MSTASRLFIARPAMAVAGLLGVCAAQQAWPATVIDGVVSSSSAVPCYQYLEVTFSLQGRFDNPFDPRQIEISGEFRTPAGKEVTMPGFLYRPYRRGLKAGREVLEPAGQQVWKVRFAPTSPGPWSYRIVARDVEGRAASPWHTFLATAASGRGYIRRSDDPHYFRYDDGTPFFGIGENMAWTPPCPNKSRT